MPALQGKTAVVAGSRPAEIVRARAAVDEATAAQQNAHTELERTAKLVAENGIPRANYDSALAAGRQADARLDSSSSSTRARHAFDLIVMATHGRSDVKRWAWERRRQSDSGSLNPPASRTCLASGFEGRLTWVHRKS